MQEKSDKFSEFSERTEILADSLRRNLSDLPAIIGVSPSMFYAYRTGKQPISDKAWRKLEAAERCAGIIGGNPISKGSSVESLSDVNEDTHPYNDKSKHVDHAERIAHLEEQVKILSAAVASMLPHGRKNLDEQGRK